MKNPRNRTESYTVNNENNSKYGHYQRATVKQKLSVTTITAENIYAFLNTGNEGEFAVDVVLAIS